MVTGVARSLGLPCPPRGPTQIAVPAVEEAAPSQGGFPSDGAVAGSDPAEPSGESADDFEVVRDPKPKGTLEEAQSREHQMTHLPKSHFCEVCSKAKMQRTQKGRTASKPSQTRGPKQHPLTSVSK